MLEDPINLFTFLGRCARAFLGTTTYLPCNDVTPDKPTKVEAKLIMPLCRVWEQRLTTHCPSELKVIKK